MNTTSTRIAGREPTPTRQAELRRREQATAAMVKAIESKIARLTAARADRIKALEKTRFALARAILAGPAAPARHDRHI